MLEVALDHGFSSAATFARAFRARFGTTATAWRAAAGPKERKPGKSIRKGRKASSAGRADTRRRPMKEAAMNIQVRESPPYHVAYMRYVGPYGPHGIPELWMKLRTWIDPRGLGSPDSITLGVAHDDPAVTAPAALPVRCLRRRPADFVPDRSVNVMDVRAGAYAVAQFEGTAHEIQGAWDRVFADVAARQRLPAGRPALLRDLSRQSDEGHGARRLPLRALPPRPPALMVSWQGFAAAAPELAELGRGLLTQFGVSLGFLATVRRDGAPRLHPVCPVISDERLFVLITPESPKRNDLLRDGRYAADVPTAESGGR